MVRDVGALELGRAEQQHPRHIGRHVAVPDDDGALRREVEHEVAVVRMAVVPSHELGSRPAPRQVLAGDPERLVGLRAGGVDHRGVVAHQLLVRDIRPDLHIAEEAAAARERLPIERVVQALDLLVVGRHPAAQEPPRRRQPLEQVDLDVAAHPPQ